MRDELGRGAGAGLGGLCVLGAAGGESILASPPHFSASPGRALARLGQMKGYRGPDEGESIGSPGEKLR